jgi:hypothetical protein
MGCNSSKAIYTETTKNEDNESNKISQKKHYCKQFNISEEKYENLKNQYGEKILNDFVNNGGNLDEELHVVIHNIYTWKENKRLINI